MGIRLKILAQVWAVGEKPAQVVETPSWTVESWTFVVKGRTNFIDGSIPIHTYSGARKRTMPNLSKTGRLRPKKLNGVRQMRM